MPERPQLARIGSPVAWNRLPLCPQHQTFRGPRWTSVVDPERSCRTLTFAVAGLPLGKALRGRARLGTKGGLRV